MGSDKPRKSCFNCTKRRIVCDLTEPTCKKCEKKGLKCPGYGIRYRFTSGQTVSSSEIGRVEEPTSTSSKRRRADLKWVDVSKPTKRKRDAELSSSISFGVNQPQAGEEEAGRAAYLTSGDQGLAEADLGVAPLDELGGASRSQADSKDCWTSTDDPIIEIDRNDHFTSLVVPNRSTILFNLPPLLSHPNPRMRLLFHHFSTHVSPVMLMYDDEANGYRRQILPLAHCDPTIERAVCVAAAFHLSQRMPELRLPAENGRAAIISKLSQTSGDLSDKTWATIILLIVAELITGHEHVIELYKMLVAFLDARGQSMDQHSTGGGSPLGEFLYNQSRIISFFAHPTLAESRAITDFSHVLQDPRGSLDEPAPRRKLPLQFLIATSEEQAWDRAISNARTKLYVDIVCEATEIYLLRASSGNNHMPVLSNPSEIAGQPPEERIEPLNDDILASRVAHVRHLFEQVDPAAPGSHTIVWPAFVAAAESRSLDDREFFSAVLRRIWESTGYSNVVRGLDALPQIWEGQTRGERWTAALPGLKTVVM